MQITDLKSEIVQLVLMEPVLKKNPWIIPVERLGTNKYLTGQNLSYQKMIGKVPLTAEEEEKYPYVISPEETYKGIDRKKYDLSDPTEKAIVGLMLQSQQVAPSETEYNVDPISFYGYLYDPEREAMAENTIEDLRYEAETLVRDLPAEEFLRIILTLNYKIKEKKFHIQVRNLSLDRQKRELLKASREYPKEVKSCFREHNPGIDTEIFIIELLHHKILDSKPNGDIYFGAEYIGVAIDDVKKYISKEEKAHIKTKWGTLLEQKKGNIPIEEQLPKDSSDGLDVMDKFNDTMMKIKSALYDEDYENAEVHLNEMRNVYRDAVREHKGLKYDFDGIGDKIEIGKATDIRLKLKREFEKLDIDQIQTKIRHHRTPYVEKDCEDIWNDREKLIEYMIIQKTHA